MSCCKIGFADRVEIVLIRNMRENYFSYKVHEELLLIVFSPVELLASLSNLTKKHMICPLGYESYATPKRIIGLTTKSKFTATATPAQTKQLF